MENRFEEKKKALNDLLAAINSEYETIRIMLLTMDTAKKNAEEKYAHSKLMHLDIFDFIEEEKNRILSAMQKKRDMVSAIKGRIQQCDEFLNEDGVESNEKDILSKLSDEIDKVSLQSNNGGNFGGENGN